MHYGSSAYLKLIRLSIESLVDLGGFTGCIYVYTTEYGEAELVLGDLIAERNVRLFTIEQSIYPLFDRYRIVETFEPNRTYIYIDCDIIATRNISNFLSKISSETFYFHKVKSNTLLDRKWYSINPLERQQIFYCNSGFFIFTLNDSVKALFKQVSERALSVPSKNYYLYGDQPIFNDSLLSFAKNNLIVDGDLLSKSCLLANDAKNWKSEIYNYYFYHHAVGWNNNIDKFSHINKILNGFKAGKK